MLFNGEKWKNLLVKSFFCGEKILLVNMLHSEKVRKPSQGVEKTYVNQNAYMPVWITFVDKSVDNVENLCFSTGIFRFFPLIHPFSRCIPDCITRKKSAVFRVMLPCESGGFLSQFPRKSWHFHQAARFLPLFDATCRQIFVQL